MSASILSMSTQSWGHRLKSDATWLHITQGEGLSNPMVHPYSGTRMRWQWRGQCWGFEDGYKCSLCSLYLL